MNPLTKSKWSPYVAGACAGGVSVFSVWAAGKYLGASTTFARSAAMLEKLLVPDHVASLDYFIKYTPKIDWQWMFVVGILLGALISSLLSGTFRFQGIPDMWTHRFGRSPGKRAAVAFLGGVIVLFGARLAGG